MNEGTDWQTPLSYALFGHSFVLPPLLQTTKDRGTFLAGLDRLAPPEMAAVRGATQTAGRLSAHPVPADIRGNVGYAQLSALLRECESLLLESPVRGPVIADRAPNAEERRLIADAPPHHRG